MSLGEEDRAFVTVAQRLSARFTSMDAREVERVVDDCRASFDGQPVRTFVAVLVEKMAGDRLRAQLPTPPARQWTERMSTVDHGGWIRHALADGKPWAIL